MFIGIGVAIAARAIGAAKAMRYRVPPQAPALPDPRVDMLQAEIEDLRTQVERLSATESFYAQLNAGQSAASPRPEVPASTGGMPAGGTPIGGSSMGATGPNVAG